MPDYTWESIESVPYTSCPSSQNKRKSAGSLLFTFCVLNVETQEHLFGSLHRIHELLGVYAVYICVLSVTTEKQLLEGWGSLPVERKFAH